MINFREAALKERLERQVLLKLEHEWEQILWGLKLRRPDLAGRMTKPLFVLSDIKAHLAEWHSSCREIRFSRNFIETARWDSICDVLCHEVAHQLASTFQDYQKETSHGKLFRECCRAVGANPGASGRYRTLEERVWGEAVSDEDAIMVKVKKLMGLASSSNLHEAEQAAAKANQLISKYAVSQIRENRPRKFESIIITEPSLKRTQAETLAASVLKNHYFVKPIWIPVYLPERSRMGMVLEISGTTTHLKLADYVFHYLLNYARRSWESYKKDHPACRSRSGYMTGVVHGFNQRLDRLSRSCEEGEERSTPNDRRVACVEDPLLLQYYSHRYPAARCSRTIHRSNSRSAYESGIRQGNRLVISKAVTGKHEDFGGLLHHQRP